MNPSPKSLLTGGDIIVVLVVALFIFANSAFRVSEIEQVIITEFGKPVGKPITEAGLHFKKPFIHKPNSVEKRVLEWDGAPTEMTTIDKEFIVVDTFARWRISEPLQYFERLRDERSALSRLDDILGSSTRDTVASNKLIEVVRSTTEREAEVSDEILDADVSGEVGVLKPVAKGRTALEQEIFADAAPKIAEFGIELLDIRFKRVNYNTSVQNKIFNRMISERQQIAERFRSEGAGEAAKILGNMERDLREVRSEAYQQVEKIRGDADAEATSIYAAAYARNDEAAALYNFTRTLKLYEVTMKKDTTAVFSTNSELFKLFKAADPEAPTTPKIKP